MAKLTGSLVKYPARATFTWFLALIAVGAILLRMPASVRPGSDPLATIDALFTATSAACVTGLTVRSTAHDLSLFGQCVLLTLIQLGGIGIITVTTFFALRLGGRETLRQRAVMTATLGASHGELTRVLPSILRFAATVELTGFALLAARNLFMNSDQTPAQNIWEGLFHSISAFCNAGFALSDGSLSRYQGDWFVNFVVMGLLIVGGIGFPVVLDIQDKWRTKRSSMWEALSVHSKLMLVGTVGLITLGVALILMLEWNHALAEMSIGRRALVALFQAVTPRTAGFQTIELARFHEATLVVIIFLMMVGAGPCSAAGGIKVSTVMILVCQSWSKFHGLNRVTLFRRSIPQELINSAMATALLFGAVAASALMMLLVVEPRANDKFICGAFEVASALGTVGLSLDTDARGAAAEPDSVSAFSPGMNARGKLVIVALMFLGRLGPLSVFIALSRAERRDRIEYPKEEILVG